MFRLSCSLLLLICHFQVCLVTAQWPKYSQQCRDDAGPPFMDDEPGVRYHDGSSAVPILQDGACAPKMVKACAKSPSNKAAYLEGPLDCGDKGWYCRIMPDPENWDPLSLTGDVNFGHCNSTDAFDDAGYDQDGHCHGSSHDSTYYWWIRDHWHRQYNGNLRCCCGWFLGSSLQPMYERRIGNRCDYRREVEKTENLDDCRDANEEHGKSFDDTNTNDGNDQKYGCDPSFKKTQINKPIPEDDSLCWEIRKFGYVEGDNGGGGGGGGGDENSDEDEDDDEDDDEDEIECSQEPMDKFFFKPKKKNGEVVGAKKKTCKWLEKKSKKKGKKHKKQVKSICKRKKGYENEEEDIYVDPAREVCMVTCQTCEEGEDEDED